LRARGRVGRLDLVVVDEVPLGVFLLAVVVVRGVLVLVGRVLVLADFRDLDARRVFVAVVLVARVVVDGYSFPKFDGDVSIAL
jgi:hypothetical protein